MNETLLYNAVPPKVVRKLLELGAENDNNDLFYSEEIESGTVLVCFINCKLSSCMCVRSHM